MSGTNKLIQDLIMFYVKENYNHHLKKNAGTLTVMLSMQIDSINHPYFPCLH